MARTVLIDRSFGETRLAILIDDRLTDLYLYRDEDPDLTGEIHRARIRRAAPALGGAFLEIAGGEAFLKGKNLPPEGSLITIEIRAEGGPGKLPIATTNLTRTLEPGVEAKANGPTRLSHNPLPWLRHVGDDEILTSSADIIGDLRRHSLEATFKQGDLFAAHGLEDEIAALISAEVPLGNGARLWIEATRALTAIDLDSGAEGEGRTSPTAARVVNDRAVPEIVRHLRLRRIGGLVAIDFLRLPDKTARMALTERMTAMLAADPMASEVAGFSRLGLFELKRTRSGRPLARDLGQNGRPTLATAARMALRAATVEARYAPGKPRPLTCAPAVASWIAAHDMAAAFQKETGAPLIVSADPTLETGRFSV